MRFDERIQVPAATILEHKVQTATLLLMHQLLQPDNEKQHLKTDYTIALGESRCTQRSRLGVQPP